LGDFPPVYVVFAMSMYLYVLFDGHDG
jgi:hypothetical protein